MSLNLGDVFVRFRVDTSGVREFQRSSQRLASQTRRVASAVQNASGSTSQFSNTLDRAARVAALTEGPLSGIASRLTTLRGLFNSGALGAAAFTASLGILISSSITATKTFLDTEDSITKLGNAIQTSSRVGQTSIEKLDKAAERLARRTLLGLGEARQVFSQAAAFQNLPTDQLERFANVAADVGAAFGRDVKGSVTQFAKALEAPASALDGLGRVGVFFSKTQREILQELVDTGQQAKATEIILGKLESRFKGFGDARGAIGALDSLEVSIQIFREQIFRTTGAGDALQRLFETLTTLFDKFSEKGSLAERTGRVLESVFNGLSNTIEFVSSNFETLQRAIEVVTVVVGAKFVSAISLGVSSLSAFSTAAVLAGKALKRFLPFAVVAGIIELVDNLVIADKSVSGLKKTFLLLRAVAIVTVKNLSMVFKDLIEAIRPSESSLKNIQIGFDNIKSAGKATLNTLVQGFALFGKAIGITIAAAVKRTQNFFTGLSSAWEGVKKIFLEGDLEGGLSQIGNAFLDGLVPGPQEINQIKSELQLAFKEVSNIDIFQGAGPIANIQDYLQINFPNLVQAFSNFGKDVEKVLKESLVKNITRGSEAAKRELKNQDPIATDMKKYFKQVQDKLVGTTESFGNSISKALGDSIVGKGSFDFKELSKTFVSQLFSALISELLVNPLVKDFQKIMKQILSSGPEEGDVDVAGGLNKKGLIPSVLGFVGGLFGGGAAQSAAGTMAQSVPASTNALGMSVGGQSVVASSGLFPSIKGHATGGVPALNRPSIVGEQGPELFMPRQRGRIVPNNELGMGGTTVNMTVVTQDAQSFRNSRNKIKSDLRSFVG